MNTGDKCSSWWLFHSRTIYKKSFPFEESFQYTNVICFGYLLSEEILDMVVVYHLFVKHVGTGLG